MRRRDKASGKATKAQRHKAVVVKRRKAAVRRRNSDAASKKSNRCALTRSGGVRSSLIRSLASRFLIGTNIS